MQITFLINSLSSGGAEKVLSIIANYLVKEYKVEIIFLEKNNFYKLNKNIKQTYLSNLNGSEHEFIKLFYIPILAFRLKKYIFKNKIKFIQSHVFRANYINVLSKLLGAKHKIQLVTAGKVSRYRELGMIGKMNLFFIRYLYPKADLLVSKSYGMKKDIQNLFNFENPHIVINNPYDIREILKHSNQEITEFDFNKNKKYLISVGRLIKLKRHYDSIEVLLKLPEKVELIILGDGTERENLIKLTKKLNLEKRVHFLGQVKNPYKYMKKADIFISCSESEGFPNVLVEAMICGIPIISSDCISGPREILGNNKYGLLFNVGDKIALLNNIKLLLNNIDIYDKYIQKAKKRSLDFRIEIILPKYKKVLLDY